MIPIANPINSRAGPVVTPLSRPGDNAVPTVAAAETEVIAVEESAAASEDVQLGHEGIAAVHSHAVDVDVTQLRELADEFGHMHARAAVNLRWIRPRHHRHPHVDDVNACGGLGRMSGRFGWWLLGLVA